MKMLAEIAIYIIWDVTLCCAVWYAVDERRVRVRSDQPRPTETSRLFMVRGRRHRLTHRRPSAVWPSSLPGGFHGHPDPGWQRHVARKEIKALRVDLRGSGLVERTWTALRDIEIIISSREIPQYRQIAVFHEVIALFVKCLLTVRKIPLSYNYITCCVTFRFHVMSTHRQPYCD